MSASYAEDSSNIKNKAKLLSLPGIILFNMGERGIKLSKTNYV